MLKALLSIIHPNQLCEGCLMGKQFHKSFSKESTSRANQPLQEIHVNIYGPIKPCSFGKNSYFLLLLIIIVERLGEEKSNVFSCFKKFKALVEKKSCYFIKSLRTNKGVNFVLIILMSFVKIMV
jgi:hypothetical protein